MERDHWKRRFTEKAAWPWPCPVCKTGRLQLEKSSVVIRETRESREYRLSKEEGDFYPGDLTERFCCLLLCNQPQCKEPVMVCGTASQDEESDGEGGTEWKRELSPTYFHPALKIIAIPEKCPNGVKAQLEKAFALYWCDSLSCANRIRNAVELLLTHLGIARYRIDPKKRRRLWLHQRIGLFRDKNKQGRQLATMMFAVKVIGNEGSHPGKLSHEDLLDAFQLVEHVLAVLFVPREHDHLAKLAQTIHKTRKPRSHKTVRNLARILNATLNPPAKTQ